MKISVLIPCYNEIHTIREILRRVRAVPIDMEIIVVDGNSTDGTRDILREEEKSPETRVIYMPYRTGRGLALKTAMKEAVGDIFLFQDADLELNPAEYPILLEPFQNPQVNVVFGSRFKGHEFEPANSWQVTGNRAITKVVNFFYGSHLTDVETGYQVFRRHVVEGMIIRGNEFQFTVELTCKILKRGYDIVEVPVTFEPRDAEAGKKLRLKDGLESVWTLLKYRIID